MAGDLARTYPLLELELQEREPAGVDQLLDAGQIDLGLVYDYTLVPRTGRHIRCLIAGTPTVLAVPPGFTSPSPICTPGD